MRPIILDGIHPKRFNTRLSALAKKAQVAQSVEQRTENPRVGGSIPPLGTISLMMLTRLAHTPAHVNRTLN